MKQITLITGETFVVDNEMKHRNSCTELDVLRFKEEGLLLESGSKLIYDDEQSRVVLSQEDGYYQITQTFYGYTKSKEKETVYLTKDEIKKILELIEEAEQ